MFSLPASVKWTHCISDILPYEDLPLLQDTGDFAGTFVKERMGGEPTENSRTQTLPGVRWSGMKCMVPESVIVKMQAYPTLKTIKEVQAFV